MPIEVRCPSCGFAGKVPDQFRGMEIACRQCKANFAILANGQTVAVTSANPPAANPPAASPPPSPPAPPEALLDFSSPAPARRPTRVGPGLRTTKVRAAARPPWPWWLTGGLAAVVVIGVGIGAVVFLTARETRPVAKAEAQRKAESAERSASPATDTSPVGRSESASPLPTRPEVRPPATKQDVKSPPDWTSADPPERNGLSGEKVYQRLLKSTGYVETGDGNGTGFLVDAGQRLLVTNQHVVDGYSTVFVAFPVVKNGKVIADRAEYLQHIRRAREDKNAMPCSYGRVVRIDARRDLALVELDVVPAGIIPLSLAAQQCKPGQNVYSVGNPDDNVFWILSSGVVRQVYHKKWVSGNGSKVTEREADVVETQSPTNHGDSGGPLVNDRARLVGVTQGGSRKENLRSFFINVTEVQRVLEDYYRERGLKYVPPVDVDVATDASVPDLVKRLSSPNSKVRNGAIVALGELGPEARVAVPPLYRLLKDDDELVRALSREALAKIGPPDRAEIGILNDGLQGADRDAKLYALGALQRLGPEGRTSLAGVLGALKDKDVTVRQRAAQVVEAFGPAVGETAWPELSARLKDNDKGVQVAALRAMVALGPPAGADVSAYVNFLLAQTTDPNKDMRQAAMLALARVPPDATAKVKLKDSVPALAKALADPDPGVSAAAVEAITRIGVEESQAPLVIPGLIGMFEQKDDWQKASAALAKIGKPAVAPLAKESASTKPAVAMVAIYTLGQIGPDARESVPAVAKGLTSLEADVRRTALDAIGKIGVNAKDEKQAEEVVRAVINMFDDEQSRERAIGTLGKIGKPAVWPLVKELSAPKKAIRIAAIEALEKIGPDAKEALPALQRRADLDTVQEVRTKATAAMRKIR